MKTLPRPVTHDARIVELAAAIAAAAERYDAPLVIPVRDLITRFGGPRPPVVRELFQTRNLTIAHQLRTLGFTARYLAPRNQPNTPEYQVARIEIRSMEAPNG